MKTCNNASGRLAGLLCAGLMMAATAQAAFADEIRIKMLDKSDSGTLAFEPGFVKVNPGDTIVFEPTQMGGHSSFSLLVPLGAQAWSGAPDKEVRVRLDKEGVYIYECAAHKMMGMAGVILVGKPVNLDEARKAAKTESAKFVLNKDRLEMELGQVK